MEQKQWAQNVDAGERDTPHMCVLDSMLEFVECKGDGHKYMWWRPPFISLSSSYSVYKRVTWTVFNYNVNHWANMGGVFFGEICLVFKYENFVQWVHIFMCIFRLRIIRMLLFLGNGDLWKFQSIN